MLHYLKNLAIKAKYNVTHAQSEALKVTQVNKPETAGFINKNGQRVSA